MTLSRPPTLNISGTIGFNAGCGKARCGYSRAGDSYAFGGVYQKVIKKNGKFLISRRYFRPTNPRTIPQQARRAVFASGVVHWQSLTSEQKSVYNEKAKKFRFEGFNLFMREWLNSN